MLIKGALLVYCRYNVYGICMFFTFLFHVNICTFHWGYEIDILSQLALPYFVWKKKKHIRGQCIYIRIAEREHEFLDFDIFKIEYKRTFNAYKYSRYNCPN